MNVCLLTVSAITKNGLWGPKLKMAKILEKTPKNEEEKNDKDYRLYEIRPIGMKYRKGNPPKERRYLHYGY